MVTTVEFYPELGQEGNIDEIKNLIEQKEKELKISKNPAINSTEVKILTRSFNQAQNCFTTQIKLIII